MTEFAGLVEDAAAYYSSKVREHGPTPAGVDWNGEQSQRLRFCELLRVIDRPEPWSILDYGCGYGALVDELRARGESWSYVGFDVSQEMLAHARRLYDDDVRCRFVGLQDELEPADYVVASGVFNVKQDADVTTWTEYVATTLERLWSLARVGCAVNMLTSYSDPDRMRPDLFYGDPCFFFDFAKRRLSRSVAVLHDYGLWEFTLIVRRVDA